MRMDISGNWVWEDAPARGLIVSQPEPPEEGNLFTQTLLLPEGRYRLYLFYKPSCDHAPKKAIFGRTYRFPVNVNGREYEIDFKRLDEESTEFRAFLPFAHPGGEMRLALRVRDTFCFGRTILESEAETALPGAGYYALPQEEADELTVVRGVPFRSAHPMYSLNYMVFWHPEQEETIRHWLKEPVDCGDTPAEMLYCLGMTHHYDWANGSWYAKPMDYGYNHFVGDKVGDLRLRYTDGGEEDIPLIYGWNVWYGKGWEACWEGTTRSGKDARSMDGTILHGNAEQRRILQEDIGLDDGIRRKGELCRERYLFTVKLDGRRLRSLQVLPQKDRYGMVVISAVTLQSSGESTLQALPCVASSEGRLTVHTLDEVRTEAWKPAIDRLQHVFYTFNDELPVLTEPLIPEDYFGPEYDFQGNQDALLTSTFLYRNGPECATYILDDGGNCGSATARWNNPGFYMQSIGLSMAVEPIFEGTSDFLRKYRQREAGEFPGPGGAWSRGVGELLREAMAFGYDKCVKNYLDWLDMCLYRYGNPPHWSRYLCPAALDFPEREIAGVIERGNRENDGHGICMWGRYMMWLWMDRDEAWNREHWQATKDACQWLQWQLDTDTVYPGVRKDVLFTLSECAHGGEFYDACGDDNGYEVYSTGNCLHGLRLSIRMAEQLGKTEEAEQWKHLYRRLAQGMLDHLQQETDLGTVWYTTEMCDWQELAHMLVHVQLATEGITYTPLEDYTDGYDAAFLEVDRRSYRYLMRDHDYDFLRMYGYGQGLMTQAALLLDEMYDAEQMVHMLVTHSYLPRFEGFLCPEGIITHPSDKFYVPVNGYGCQDSHIADAVKALRVMFGVDDNRKGHLHLVPRFPASWSRSGITQFPVLTDEGRGTISYVIRRGDGHFRMDISLSAPTTMDLRVGPFARMPGDRILVNGEARAFAPFRSGDSWWGWIRGVYGTNCSVEL